MATKLRRRVPTALSSSFRQEFADHVLVCSLSGRCCAFLRRGLLPSPRPGKSALCQALQWGFQNCDPWTLEMFWEIPERLTQGRNVGEA